MSWSRADCAGPRNAEPSGEEGDLVGSRALIVTDSKAHRPSTILVGLVRIREHCTFNWRQPEGAVQTILVLPHHCEDCLREARRRGFRLARPDGTDFL